MGEETVKAAQTENPAAGEEKKKKFNITLWITIGLLAGLFIGLIMPEWLYDVLSVIANIYMNALRMMI